MLDRVLPPFWNILFRVALSAGATAAIALKVHVTLPGPALISIGQIIFYLTFVVSPPPLPRLLLKPEIDAKLAALRDEQYQLPLDQGGQAPKSMRVNQFWDTVVERASNVHFVDKVAEKRTIKINEYFHRNLVPVGLVTAGAIYLAIEQASAPATGVGGERFLSFVQALLSLLPLMWTFGNIYGEIDTHRDVVRAAL